MTLPPEPTASQIAWAVKGLREELLAGEDPGEALQFISDESGVPIDLLRRKFRGTFKVEPEDYVPKLQLSAQLAEDAQMAKAKEIALRRAYQIYHSPEEWTGRFFIWFRSTYCFRGYRHGRAMYRIYAVDVATLKLVRLPATLIPSLNEIFAE